MCSFLDTSEIDHPFGSAYVKAKLFAVSEMFMAFGVVAVLLGLRTMLNKKEWFVNLINQKWKRDKQNGNFEICFETEDFDSICKTIKEQNIPMLHDLHEESWGQKTIRVFDPDNNLVEIGESIPTFIKRMYEEGMSVGEIVERSSVGKEEVEGMIG